MAEVFNLDAVLELRSNVGPLLSELAGQFRDLDKLVKSTQETLGAFERILKDLSGSTRSIRSLARALEQVSRVNFSGLAAGEKPLAGIAANLEKIAQTDTGAIRQFSQAMGRLASADLGPAAREIGRVTTALDNAVSAERRLEQTAGQAAQALSRQARAAATPTHTAQGITAPTTTQRQATAFEETAKAAKDAAASMERMAKVDFAKAVSGADRLTKALEATAQASQKVESNATRVADAWGKAAQSAQNAANAMRGVQAAGGGRGGSGGSGTGVPSSGRAHRTAGGLHHDDLLFTGIGLGAIGETIKGALEEVFRSGIDVQHRIAQLRLAGFSASEVETARQAAFQTQRNLPGTGVETNLEIIRDLNSVVQNHEEAMRFMPAFARMGAILGAEGKGDQVKELFDAMRAGELRGAISKPGSKEIDPQRFQEFIQGLTTAVVGTAGRITPRDYANFLQQAGVGGVRLSDQFLLTEAPALMMAMKSVRAGTAVSSFNQTEFGRLFKSYGQEQERIGLIAPGGFVAPKGFGGGGTIRPGMLKGAELAQTDLREWAVTVVEPLIRADIAKRTGVGAVNMKDPAAVLNAELTELYRLFPRSTITRLFEDILRNRAMFENYNRALGPQGAMKPAQFFQDLQSNDVQIHLTALGEAIKAFGAALSGPAQQTLVKYLDELTAAFNKMAAWAQAHPKMAHQLVEVAAGLTAVAVALGALSTALFFLGPMLRTLRGAARLVGIGGGGAAAAESAGGVAAAAAGKSVLGSIAPAVSIPLTLSGDAGPNSGGVSPQEAAKIRADAVRKGIPTPGQAIYDWLFGSGSTSQVSPPTPKKGDSAGNPVNVYVTNQLKGSDIRDGVTRHQADQLTLPSAQPSWFDPSQTPGLSPNPIGP